MSQTKTDEGMSATTARRIERSIIALCLISLVFIFQPFSKLLYGIGAGLVILGGLSFNLVPLCRPGKPLRGLVRAGVIVVVLLLTVAALAIGSAYLYGVYLTKV